MTFVKEVLDNGKPVEKANDTFVVLIPEVEYPKTIFQFRLISLCNVSHKIITKLIALRLREYLGKIVSPNQASLVPGRHIQDNIIIVQELIHTIDKFKKV